MTDWVAACMEPDEWALWTEANRRSAAHRISRPCEDCPLGFALEMRAIGRCNGEPAGAPEDEDQEDEPMEIAQVKAQPVAVAVTAPCETCIHREVCAIRLSIDAVAHRDVDVILPKLDVALKPTLTMAIDCSFYARDRAVKLTSQVAAAGRSGWTEERKARWHEQMAARRAAKAEREAAA
jgi:hypothetical protein